MDCYERLSKNLKQLRKHANKTQEVAAREANILRANFGRYETGENVPPLDILIRLADYYDVTVDELLKEEL